MPRSWRARGRTLGGATLRVMGNRASMTCPSCGTPNEPGRKFCGECGTRLAAVCPRAAPPNPPERAVLRRVRRRRIAGVAGGARRPLDRPPAALDRPAPRPSPSAASSPSCSPTSSASRRSPRAATPRRSASSCRRYFELAAERHRRATAAPSRSSSATRSWPSGARRSRTRTTPSGPSARRSSSSTPCAALGPGIQARARRADRRGGGHARRHQPGHGRGRPRQHRVAAAVGRAAGHRARRRGRRSGPRAARSRSSRPASRCSRARPRRCRRGGRCGSSPSAAAAAATDRLEAPFVGRDDELRLLKDLFHATARERRVAARLGHRARPASARAGSPGSS